MAKWQERTELLFKSEGLTNLKNANVLIVGLGGVGSFSAEFLVRAGAVSYTHLDVYKRQILYIALVLSTSCSNTFSKQLLTLNGSAGGAGIAVTTAFAPLFKIYSNIFIM